MKRSTSPRVVANWYRPRTSATPANTGSRPRGTVWTSSPISSLIGALCARVTGLCPGVTGPWPRALDAEHQEAHDAGRDGEGRQDTAPHDALASGYSRPP